MINKYNAEMSFVLTENHPNYEYLGENKEEVLKFEDTYTFRDSWGEDHDRDYILNDLLQIAGSTNLNHYKHFNHKITKTN